MARKPPNPPPPKTYPKATRTQAKTMYDAGVGFAEIARRLGVSRSTLVRWSTEDKWRTLKLVAEAPASAASSKARAEAKRPKAKAKPQSERPATVASMEPRRRRRSLLEAIQDARDVVSDALSDAKANDILQAVGPIASALCRLADKERELDPLSPYEWVKVAVERGWDVTQLAEAVVEERRVG